jgi:hypothetical protein
VVVDRIECTPFSVVIGRVAGLRKRRAGRAAPGRHAGASSYVRQMHDISVGGRPMLVHLKVRFIRTDAACRTVTFAWPSNITALQATF